MKTYQPISVKCTISSVPMNQADYNHRFGKKQRFDPRLDWNYNHFIKGVKTPTYIHIGSRDCVLGKIIKCAVFNTFNCNVNHHTHWDYKNVIRTVMCTIRRQFENAESFIQENKNKIAQQCYNEWNHSQSLTFLDYYNECLKSTKEKAKTKYTPKNYTLKQLFYKNQIIMESITDYNKLKTFIAALCNNDEKMMKTMWRYYKMYCTNKLDGRKYNCSKRKDYSDIIKTMSKNEIQKMKEDNKSFRRWCKENMVNKTSLLLLSIPLDNNCVNKIPFNKENTMKRSEELQIEIENIQEKIKNLTYYKEDLELQMPMIQYVMETRDKYKEPCEMIAKSPFDKNKKYIIGRGSSWYQVEKTVDDIIRYIRRTKPEKMIETYESIKKKINDFELKLKKKQDKLNKTLIEEEFKE